MNNQLDTKKLTRIQSIILQISNLDVQISQIQNLAEHIANGKTIDISLEGILTTQAGTKTKVMKNGSTVFEVQVTDRRQPTIFGIPMNEMFGGEIYSGTQSKIQPHNKVSIQVAENISLRVLALVLEEKLEQKQKLVNKLNRLGVK